MGLGPLDSAQWLEVDAHRGDELALKIGRTLDSTSSVPSGDSNGRSSTTRVACVTPTNDDGPMKTSSGLFAVAVLSLTGNAVAAAAMVGLPAHARTPGAVNSQVTQATIHSTICVAGYSASIRPSESYTERLKFAQLDDGYNLAGDTRASHYEEDHLIPLEVGGSPTSVRNLWPEPRNVVWGASRKDRLENALHRLVCSGTVPLATAQRVFAVNWIAGYQRYVGP